MKVKTTQVVTFSVYEVKEILVQEIAQELGVDVAPNDIDHDNGKFSVSLVRDEEDDEEDSDHLGMGFWTHGGGEQA